MLETYKYLYTKISTQGSLPTYKVFSNTVDATVKWVFADNTYVYGHISDWSFNHIGLDSGKALWSEETKVFLELEKRKLNLYRDSHSDFKTIPMD